jgi:hypothetical protein
MSLKALHVVFVAASLTLCLGFGLWCLREFTASGQPVQVVMAGCAGVAALGLVIYGRQLWIKLKALSNL